MKAGRVMMIMKFCKEADHCVFVKDLSSGVCGEVMSNKDQRDSRINSSVSSIERHWNARLWVVVLWG